MPPVVMLAAVLLMQDHVVAAPSRVPLPRPSPAATAVAINDNRRPAGARRGDTLVIELDVVEGGWRPEGPDDPEVPVLAFAERGGRPQVPGPLVRAPQGTPVRLVLRSRVDSALVLGGLRPGTRQSGADTVHLAARGTREVRFRLDSIGSFIYWGAFPGLTFVDREWLDSQLTGAIVVDPKGGSPPDRVFVVTEWFHSYRDRPFESALVFNGKAWPHTERLTLAQGDSVRWRILNAAAVPHPMHLHGFYFRVARRGRWNADTAVAAERQPLVNVQLMPVGGTMSIGFVPTTPGNWVFHCHFADHVGAAVSLSGSPRDAAASSRADHAGHAGHAGHAASGSAGHQMRGLVLGLHVTPAPDYTAPPANPARAIRLLVQSQPNRLIGNRPAVGFVVQRGDTAPRRDSVALPGPTLELVRGKPVRIVVVNNLEEPTGVHWHGLEIESLPDGVPGWSGTGKRIMPPIAPRDSFVAEFTPPRSGTFLYHSHANEIAQIGSGMYGAIVVSDAPRDTTRDHIVIAGGGGLPVYAKQAGAYGLVNGRRSPRPLRLAAGTPHRLRLISIDPMVPLIFTLTSDSAVVRWRAVAKDGADLPPALAADGLSRVTLGPGETADYEWTPPAPGRWRLDIRTESPGWWSSLELIVADAPEAGTGG